jgi:hypothetical protein
LAAKFISLARIFRLNRQPSTSYRRKDMRRIVASIAFLLAFLTPVYAVAQGFNPAGGPPWVLADSYGRWVLQGQAANTYTFNASGFSPCRITQLNFSDSSTFYAFSNAVALAPVFVSDNNQANSEVVTPGSFLAPTQSSCGPALAPTNAHITFSLQSGTGGLQEAINIRGVEGRLWTVVLSGEWYKLISNIAGSNATLTNSITPTGTIFSVTCSSTVGLVDVTTNPFTNYSCNPTTHKYVIAATNQTAPTVAAGAGSGTAPTIALVGSGSQGTVTLTTGTAVPASASTIFTLTWPATTAGGFAYAPNCTITSVGTVAGPGTNASVVGPPAVDTFTSLSAGLASSTAGYKWTYSCH